MKRLYFVLLFLLPCLCEAQTSKEWFLQGQQALTEKNHEKALDCFEKASELDKNNPEIHACIGVALINLGRYSKAISPLKTAQKLSPLEGKYYYYQAVALDSMGKAREVLEVTSKAMKVNDKQSEVYALRAEVYIRQKEYNTAIANLNKAIEINRRNGLAYMRRAYAKHRVVDSAGACADWKLALGFGIKEAQQMLDEHCKE
ncbi:MAG: tetratricopeptide repeat protein [Bacteroidetes bacterium]|nr:MAG: tetratricopeptide repeat protein [Bacteroidota bacterium]